MCVCVWKLCDALKAGTNYKLQFVNKRRREQELSITFGWGCMSDKALCSTLYFDVSWRDFKPEERSVVPE